MNRSTKRFININLFVDLLILKYLLFSLFGPTKFFCTHKHTHTHTHTYIYIYIYIYLHYIIYNICTIYIYRTNILYNIYVILDIQIIYILYIDYFYIYYKYNIYILNMCIVYIYIV